jgi:hypothetical protein
MQDSDYFSLNRECWGDWNNSLNKISKEKKFKIETFSKSKKAFKNGQNEEETLP